MAYGDFAHWYDALNDGADYDRLAAELVARLRGHGITEGIVADLGCGTGELTLRLAKAGYDMIAVDASAEMLERLREKAGSGGDVLLLQQRLESLDLFGTIRAAVSTFDTFSHLNEKQLSAALGKAALFTEPGGLLLFDVNTPYKHEQVLHGNLFEAVAGDGVVCEWSANCHGTECNIELVAYKNNIELFYENFIEYSYTAARLKAMLAKAGYDLLERVDGETFKTPGPQSQRWLLTARKKNRVINNG